MGTSLFLGLLLGMRHALEADHVAAVVSLATRGGTLRGQAAQGALWGLGHTLTLLLVAGTCVALGLSIPADLERAFEALVGVMLIALGVSVLVRLRMQRVHWHAHTHADGAPHLHAHSHAGELGPRHDHVHARVPLQALFVGVVHGLAGSAALVLLSVRSAHSVAQALASITLFGAGSIVGMMALAAGIAWPLGAARKHAARTYACLCTATGLCSMLVGARLVWTFVG